MSKRILYDEIKNVVDGLDGFHCYGLYNGQFEREPDEDVVRYPAVYIQFEPIEWSNVLGSVKNLQEGAIDIQLHVGFKRLDKDNESVLDDVDKLFVALEGYAHNEFDPLRRRREFQDIGYDNVEVWVLVFRTRLRDCQATMTGTITHTIESLDARTESSIKIDNDVIRSASADELELDT